jgi:hypothetical protein
MTYGHLPYLVGRAPVTTLCSGGVSHKLGMAPAILLFRTAQDAGGARPAVTKQGAPVGTMRLYLERKIRAIATANAADPPVV